MTPSLGIEPGLHCWEVSALKTTSSLLPIPCLIIFCTFYFLPSDMHELFHLSKEKPLFIRGVGRMGGNYGGKFVTQRIWYLLPWKKPNRSNEGLWISFGMFLKNPLFYGERVRANGVKRKQIKEDFRGHYSDVSTKNRIALLSNGLVLALEENQNAMLSERSKCVTRFTRASIKLSCWLPLSDWTPLFFNPIHLL